MNMNRLGLIVWLLLLPTSVQAQEPVAQTPEGVVLDFQDTDLRLVISALAEAAGLNLMYAELPARTVTLRMNEPVSAADIPELLRSFAETQGLRIEEVAGVLHVEAAVERPATDPTYLPGSSGSQAGGRRLYVHRLRHAQAGVLAQTLSSLFGGSGRRVGTTSDRPAADESGRTARIPPMQPDPQLDFAPEQGGLESILPGELRGDVQIVPDEPTNAILVRAGPEDWEVVRQAIDQLDLRPLQVLIEVHIVEVRRASEHEVGISLGQIDSLSGPPHERVQPQLRGALGGDFVVTVRRPGGLDLDAALSLLSASGDVRILSRPVILAQNNQEARILVGSERPFVQVFRALPTESAIRDQIVQYREVGTSLTIVPTINVDGYVNLDVRQEVSTATTETQFGAPVISTREAATRLLVRDGQTVVIGGLIDQQRDWSRSGVPLLKDLPIIGYVFGTTRQRELQTELFLFLTPHIVASDEDADSLREGILEGTHLPSVPLPTFRGMVPDTIPPEAGTPDAPAPRRRDRRF